MANDALSHIEKSLADSYRKEIDQEENIWRSLPFFATTIALQIAALGQFISRLPPLGTLYSLAAIVFLTLTGLLMLIALSLLAASIKHAKFQYIAREPLLFRYAEDLIAAERAAVAAGDPMPPIALEILQKQLSIQYAVGADHNRQITKKREEIRTWAGLAIIGSMTTTLSSCGDGVDFPLYSEKWRDDSIRYPFRSETWPCYQHLRNLPLAVWANRLMGRCSRQME